MIGQKNLTRWMRAVPAAIALAVCLGAYGDDVIDPNNGYGPTNRPVFAFFSVTDTFDLPSIETVDGALRESAPFLGSPMVRVKIGQFNGGFTVKTSRFVSSGPAAFDPALVPPDPDTGEAADFDGNHVTIVGSFKTLPADSKIHLMTPYQGVILTSVQRAYFNASVFFDDAVGGLNPFATTVESALFIYDHQGAAGASMNEILQGVFHVDPVKPVVLACSTICTGEGELFPHDPDELVFGFDIDFDHENGLVDADICYGIDIDVKPGNSTNSVHVTENGVLPIAVLTTADFNATSELDPSTVEAVLVDGDGEVVNEIGALRYDLEDVDHDGDDDVTFKFSVPDLVSGPNAPLTASTMSITFRGETYDGMCVQGSDSIRIVPQSH